MAGIFPDEWIEEVRSRNDIVEIVSEYVQLKPSGRRFVGLCPFHNEKTASFHVNADEQFFYCFGCQTGGDVIRFIMNIEKLNFVESVKLLAERAHLPLPEQIDEKEYARERDRKERLYEIGRVSARFFYNQLFSPQGKRGLDYLLNRGIQEKTINRFGLGFAVDGWDNLLQYLLTKGFSYDEIAESGLIVVKGERKYDRFRNRIMFPIINIYGKVIGFGGRVLDGSQPKYLNSPETAVFNKSENLFGLNFIKEKSGLDKILIVEGYMDVISLHQNGFDMAVASLGTSLTVQQARLLKRYSKEVYIAYDGDTAGQKATLRGLDILTAEGCQVKVMTFPDNMDPDEFINKKGNEAFVQQMEKALPVIEYKLKLLRDRYDISTQEGKVKFAIESSKILSTVVNPVEREVYIKRLQLETGFSYDVLNEQISKSQTSTARDGNGRNRIGNNRYNNGKKLKPIAIATHIKAEQNLLAFIFRRPEKINFILNELDIEDFTLSLHQRLMSTAVEQYAKKRSIQYDEIISCFPDEEDVNKITEIFSLQLEYDNIEKFIQDCVNEIKRYKIENQIKECQNQLKQIGIDRERRIRIMAEIQSLNLEYRKYRRG